KERDSCFERDKEQTKKQKYYYLKLFGRYLRKSFVSSFVQVIEVEMDYYFESKHPSTDCRSPQPRFELQSRHLTHLLEPGQSRVTMIQMVKMLMEMEMGVLSCLYPRAIDSDQMILRHSK